MVNEFINNEFESVYKDLNKLFKQSYSKFPEFLKFSSNFQKSGKQGLLGIIKYKKNDNKTKIVYKISQYMNYLIEQENMVMQSLNRLRSFCPNFCKGYGMLNVPISPAFRKVDNPFEIEDRYKIMSNVLMMEHIDPAKKLYKYLKNKDVSEDVVFSLIKQSLIAIQIAQNKNKFTHYDLHSNNILVKKCEKNSCMLYILDNNNTFLIPTFGNYPVIIDYGFSYVQDMQNNPLYSALPHTDVGFMSDRFDPIADPKLFLVTVSDELKKYRESKSSKLFRKIVRNIFNPLKIDWESGWDESNDIGASDYILNMLEDVEKKTKSKFFKHCGHYCVDISQKLITLPLKPNKYKNIEDIYSLIIEEYKKIEKEIKNDFYNLYIFKNMIDIADKVKSQYHNENTRNEAVKSFKNNLLNLINDVAKFCNPKLDFEKLLCSLFIFAKKMEGILYEVMTERMKVKNKEYGKMKIHYASEMHEAIEVNIPTNFSINKDTKIYVWDCINETSTTFKIPELYLNDINNLNNLEKGYFVRQLLQNNSDENKTQMKNDIILSDITEEDEFDDFDEENQSEVHDEDDDEVKENEKDDEFDEEDEEDEEDGEDEEEEEEDELFDEDMDGSDIEKMLESLS